MEDYFNQLKYKRIPVRGIYMIYNEYANPLEIW